MTNNMYINIHQLQILMFSKNGYMIMTLHYLSSIKCYTNLNNPKEKRNLETKRKMKIKVMILCHILADYRNCKITNVTGAIGSYIYRSGLGRNVINLLSNILCFPRYETVSYKSKNTVKDHLENINRYIA